MSDATCRPLNQRTLCYPAPDDAPARTVCRRIYIPNDPNIIAAVNDVLVYLTQETAWIESPGVPNWKIRALITQMWFDFTESDCMIGTVVPVVRAVLPDWMLPADGGTYQRADYPSLYELIDTEYIIDSDTFRTPDLRGLTVIGASDAYPVDATGGAVEHVLTVDQIPSHSHSTPPHSHTYFQYTFGIDIESVGVPDPTGVGQPALPNNTEQAVVTIDSTGGDQAHNNMQPYRSLRYAVIAR